MWNTIYVVTKCQFWFQMIHCKSKVEIENKNLNNNIRMSGGRKVDKTNIDSKWYNINE